MICSDFTHSLIECSGDNCCNFTKFGRISVIVTRMYELYKLKVREIAESQRLTRILVIFGIKCFTACTKLATYIPHVQEFYKADDFVRKVI